METLWTFTFHFSWSSWGKFIHIKLYITFLFYWYMYTVLKIMAGQSPARIRSCPVKSLPCRSFWPDWLPVFLFMR
jgi:hypothetical protein